MGNSMGRLSLCFRLWLEKPLQAACRPLAPRPRGIQYGEGRPARKPILISITATVRREDRFAVGELASAPSEINGKRVPVVSNRTAAHIIVLDRTGAVDALTGPDDQAGLDSKDAYTLRITKRGPKFARALRLPCITLCRPRCNL
jgi:hypothetical protein